MVVQINSAKQENRKSFCVNLYRKRSNRLCEIRRDPEAVGNVVVDGVLSKQEAPPTTFIVSGSENAYL